jgi:hypothetical protein
VFNALCIYLALFGLQQYVQRRPIGKYLRNFEHAILQEEFVSEGAMQQALHSDDELPVVIDISAMRGDRTSPTDRTALEDLIDTVRGMQALAVGLDIDFSPEDNGAFITGRDPRLFEKWQNYRNVRVGVYRREGQPANTWLGTSNFKDLAAGMTLPEGDSQYAYYFSRPEPDCLLELASSLALYSRGEIATCGLARRRFSIRDGDMSASYPVDYSHLSRIKVIPYKQKGDLSGKQNDIWRRVVLVGDVKDGDDLRCLSYRADPVAGVMIHAASFATLNHQLREFDGRSSQEFDIVLFIVVAVLMAGLRYLQTQHARFSGLNLRQLELVSACFISVSILAGCLLFARLARVFWPDFLWIAAAYFITPYLVEVWGIIWSSLKTLVFPHGDAPHAH